MQSLIRLFNRLLQLRYLLQQCLVICIWCCVNHFFDFALQVDDLVSNENFVILEVLFDLLRQTSVLLWVRIIINQVEVGCEQEAVEVIVFIWSPENMLPNEPEHDVVLVVQITSGGIGVYDLLFEDILISLWNITDQEITQDDEEDDDSEYPAEPDQERHYSWNPRVAKCCFFLFPEYNLRLLDSSHWVQKRMNKVVPYISTQRFKLTSIIGLSDVISEALVYCWEDADHAEEVK